MKHGGVNQNNEIEKWDEILAMANQDFVSVLVLWYNGISPGGTYGWMFSHALEKYIKAYLLQFDSVTNKELKKMSHDLKLLWQTFKIHSNTKTNKDLLNQAFDEIIDDISTIEPKIRYKGYVSQSSDRFLYFFIVLCSFIRYLIIGKSKYRSTLYGIEDEHFLLMNYNPMSEGYGKQIVSKMLHLVLEHGCMFTNMGFVNAIEFKDYSISNTALMQRIDGCPICDILNNKRILRNKDQMYYIEYYRDIKPTKIK